MQYLAGAPIAARANESRSECHPVEDDNTNEPPTVTDLLSSAPMLSALRTVHSTLDLSALRQTVFTALDAPS